MLALKSAPVGVGALFRALSAGEVDRALQSAVRQDALLPARAVRVSDSQAGELAKAYRAGASIAQITTRFGLNKTTVAAHLHAEGVVMRNQVGEQERRRIAELASGGLSLNKLGRLTGRDPKTVKAVLKRERARTSGERLPRTGARPLLREAQEGEVGQ